MHRQQPQQTPSWSGPQPGGYENFAYGNPWGGSTPQNYGLPPQQVIDAIIHQRTMQDLQRQREQQQIRQQQLGIWDQRGKQPALPHQPLPDLGRLSPKAWELLRQLEAEINQTPEQSPEVETPPEAEAPSEATHEHPHHGEMAPPEMATPPMAALPQEVAPAEEAKPLSTEDAMDSVLFKLETALRKNVYSWNGLTRLGKIDQVTMALTKLRNGEPLSTDDRKILREMGIDDKELSHLATHPDKLETWIATLKFFNDDNNPTLRSAHDRWFDENTVNAEDVRAIRQRSRQEGKNGLNGNSVREQINQAILKPTSSEAKAPQAVTPEVLGNEGEGLPQVEPALSETPASQKSAMGNLLPKIPVTQSA